MKEKISKVFGDERAEVLNLYEKYILCKEKDITLFGNNFYTPNVWKWVEKNFKEESIGVETYGLFNDCERRMICFNNKYYADFPIKCIKIINTSKFITLKHKDYLGSILGLGIQRNKIGDLIVDENCCYVPVHLEIAEYILYNLEKIGKTSCKVQIIEDKKDFPKVSLKEEIILVSSLRLDSLICKICNTARSKAVSIIEQGLVLVDYNVVREKSHEVNIDERITIRKKGKFIVGNIIGNSKSGKVKLVIKKYT